MRSKRVLMRLFPRWREFAPFCWPRNHFRLDIISCSISVLLIIPPYRRRKKKVTAFAIDKNRDCPENRSGRVLYQSTAVTKTNGIVPCQQMANSLERSLGESIPADTPHVSLIPSPQFVLFDRVVGRQCVPAYMGSECSIRGRPALGCFQVVHRIS